MGYISNISKVIALILIKLYQHTLSLCWRECCRFDPSCSHYAAEAIQKHGLCYGMYLITRRLLRCHPWHQGGFDPVP